MSGHVFVVHSDITALRCDAWLLPSDRYLNITGGWLLQAPAEARNALCSPTLRTRWDLRSSRTLEIDPWYPELGSAPAPVPILTDVGASSDQTIDWYIEGLTEFVEAAVAIKSAPGWRTKRLFAVPLIGTGEGGQEAQKGRMARKIIDALNTAARERDVDFALVLRDLGAYTAAQAVRRDSALWEFEKHERERLDVLADHANRNGLVLFIGSGLSSSAGLPLWKDLLGELAADEGSSEISALRDLSLLDAAAILDRRFRATGRDLKAEAARRTTTPCFGLGHALTAALPVSERVTTNYDDCVELSLKAAQETLSVLPYNPIRCERSWLLKLHGTISVPSQIVLTRQDYLRYESGRGALYGIVQAMMLTRHILFLGFSLTDENFNALVDEVRRALEGISGRTDADRFGTAFVPTENTTAAELWDTEMYIEQLGTKESYPRSLEIALDYLALATTSAARYLLDDSYDVILTDEEHRLKALVSRLAGDLEDRDLASPTFARIMDLLEDLGSSRRTEINVARSRL